jgi:two-component system response regulator PilR (NtrC family)
MESEFFGHKKGSFTGAVSDKEGLFRSAEGGTLFLDEVADLPLHMQVKLLRVIQEKAVRPVGELREVPVDVRVLSATHQKLDDLVKAGKFREDLYYRINVIELAVPALRDRKDDLPMLIDVLLDRVSKQMGSKRPAVSEAAMHKLLTYGYPGNVRELENILERAVTLCASNTVGPTTSSSGSSPRSICRTPTRTRRQTISKAIWNTSNEKRSSVLSNRPAITRRRPRSCWG